MKVRKINESRSSVVSKMIGDIDSIWGASGVDNDAAEKILMKHHANSDDSGIEGYFTGMSDTDIKGAWNDIKDMLQKKYSTGAEMDSDLIKTFDLKLSKDDFKKTYDKMKRQNSSYAEGFCDAVAQVVSVYGLKL